MKHNIIIMAMALTATMTACSLDKEPIDTFSELTEGKSTTEETAVLKDKAAADEQLKNLYELLRNRQEHSHLDLLLIAESHSDNAYAGTTGAEVAPYENNSIDASNSVLSRDWSRYLEDIAQANVLINGVEQLRDKGLLTESEYHTYKSQGQIFRALQMWPMARLWGSFPVITSIAQTITSDNIHEVYPTYFPPRSTQEECYAQIIADLTEAETYAPDFNTADRTLFTKTVAQAMLAKVYAEKAVQDHDQVIAYAQKVMSTAGLQLEQDFETLWGWDAEKGDAMKRNTTEGILEVHWMSGSGNWESWMYGRALEDPEGNFTWAKWITPSRDLAAAYDKAGDAIRKDQTIHYEACSWSNYYPASNYAFMYKLRSGYNNLYKLRLADIMLIAAEAQAYKGNTSESARLVNQVRSRVGLAPVSASTSEAMLDLVLTERRLELAMEGERWFDLVRNGKVEEVMNGINNRDTGRLPQQKVFDANSYLLPLPQSALDENNNLQQNPGY